MLFNTRRAHRTATPFTPNTGHLLLLCGFWKKLLVLEVCPFYCSSWRTSFSSRFMFSFYFIDFHSEFYHFPSPAYMGSICWYFSSFLWYKMRFFHMFSLFLGVFSTIATINTVMVASHKILCYAVNFILFEILSCFLTNSFFDPLRYIEVCYLVSKHLHTFQRYCSYWFLDDWSNRITYAAQWRCTRASAALGSLVLRIKTTLCCLVSIYHPPPPPPAPWPETLPSPGLPPALWSVFGSRFFPVSCVVMSGGWGKS